MFKVGQKVVCIDAGGVATGYLALGATYTVERCRSGKSFFWAETQKSAPGEGLRLVEAPIADYYWFNEQRFEAAPLHKTDIGIFKKLLAPKRQRELAE